MRPKSPLRNTLHASRFTFHVLRLTLLTLLTLPTLQTSHSATIPAVTGSPQHLQSAIDLAAEGDTVLVPGGTSSWSTNIVCATPISLIATGATILLDDIVADANNKHRCFFDFETASNKSYRISGFVFAAGTARPSTSYSVGAIALYGYSDAVRVDHCSFSNLWNNGIYVNGWVRGVADHCSFQFNRNQHGLFIHHPNWGGSQYGFGDYSFYEPAQYGTSNAWYVEDCTFTNSDGFHGGIDGHGGMRVVARHNTFSGEYIGIHGTESGGRLRSPRTIEIYNNTFNGYGNQTAAILLRGGTGPIYSNIIGAGYKRPIGLAVYRTYHAFPTWGGATGVNPWDSNSPSLYWEGQHLGADGSAILQAAAPGWTTNQWTGYTLYTTNDTGATRQNFSEILSNNSDTIWYRGDSVGPDQDLLTTNAWYYQIRLVYSVIGAPGHGQGILLDGSAQAPVWPQDAIEPVYAWSNIFYGTNVGGAEAVQTLRILEGREFTNNVVMPNYAPYIYPHPLAGVTAPDTQQIDHPLTRVTGNAVVKGNCTVK